MREARGNLLRLAWFVLFLGLLLTMWRRHGDSPLLWLDTLNDDHLVRGCLEHDECRTRGATVSFGTLVQGGSWHELRAAVWALGIERTGLHRLLLILDALALLLIAVTASRLAGVGAAVLAVAAWLALDDIAQMPGELLWNYRPILWLAAITTALGLHLIRGAGPGTAALTGALSAVLTGCHLLGLTLAGPLFWATLWSCKRRLAGAGAFVAAFLAVAAASSFESWSVNLGSLGAIGAHPSGASGAATGGAMVPWLLTALCALGLWLGPPERRRDFAHLTLLAGCPLLTVLLVGKLSSLPTPPTYLTAAFPALAIGSAAGIVLLARRCWGTWRRATPAPAARAEPAHAPAAALALFGMVIATLPHARTHTLAHIPHPSFADIAEVVGRLRAEGWTREELFAGLKGPMAPLVIEAMAHDFPPGSADRRRAYLLPLVTRPEPFPAAWREFGHHALVETPGVIDWTRLQACADCQESECREAPLVPAPFEFERLSTTISGMPDIGSGERRPFCLRFPLDERAAAVNGIHVLAFPDLDFVCQGRIVAVPSGGLVLDGGRRALLLTPNAGGELWIRYEPGSTGCPLESLCAFPPFLLEGPEPEVALMQLALSPTTKIGKAK
ncbi:MAG: hypothetical protein GYA21_07185 [Myxococcales bacterium]|nr:hypothetical protein [Myxococcales bacterium]